MLLKFIWTISVLAALLFCQNSWYIRDAFAEEESNSKQEIKDSVNGAINKLIESIGDSISQSIRGGAQPGDAAQSSDQSQSQIIDGDSNQESAKSTDAPTPSFSEGRRAKPSRW